jgi:uncharacterized protein YaiE (UPF0345 family)
MKKNMLEYLKIIILTLVLIGGAASLKAWTGPTATPPNGNVAAPINVSNSLQTKLGSLILNAATPIQNTVGLAVFGTSTFNGEVVIADGTQGAGKVLTSDANGNTNWQTPASSNGLDTTPASYFYDLSIASGNNASIIKYIGLLSPGTYTFSGKITTTDGGGGGSVALFLNTSDSLTISTAQSTGAVPATCVGSSGGTGTTYKAYYNTDDSKILFCLKRNGNNDGSFTIPNTTITVSTPTFIYYVASQATAKGYIHY